MRCFSRGAPTTFRWRTCDIHIGQLKERHGLIDASGDTVDSLQHAMLELDRRLFAGAFDRNTIEERNEEQIREWVDLVLRAWALGITEYRPEPGSTEIAPPLPDVSETAWAERRERYRLEETERAKATAARNKPRFELAWATLRDLNVPLVVVEFSGEGDSGDVHSVEPEFHDETNTPNPDEQRRDHLKLIETFHAREVLVPGKGTPIMLAELIKDLSEHMLSRDEVPDWDNEAGGFGTLEWRVVADGTPGLTATVHLPVLEYNTTSVMFDAFGGVVKREYLGRTQ